MFFLSEKEKAVKKKTRHEKHTQMGFELLPLAWRSSMYQLVHSVHYNLQVFESVNLSFDKKKISCRFWRQHRENMYKYM